MQEQPIISRQGTEFRSGDQINFQESTLTPYEQIEAMRLIGEAFAGIDAKKTVEQTATVSPEARAEMPLSPEDRIGRIGLNLAAMRTLAKSDLDLAV